MRADIAQRLAAIVFIVALLALIFWLDRGPAPLGQGAPA